MKKFFKAAGTAAVVTLKDRAAVAAALRVTSVALRKIAFILDVVADQLSPQVATS